MFNTKIEKGFDFLRGKRILIAFSGGVDSTLVAWIASEITEVFLLTIVSEWISSEEITEAKTIAEKLKLPHSLLKVEINDSHFFTIYTPYHTPKQTCPVHGSPICPLSPVNTSSI